MRFVYLETFLMSLMNIKPVHNAALPICPHVVLVTVWFQEGQRMSWVEIHMFPCDVKDRREHGPLARNKAIPRAEGE